MGNAAQGRNHLSVVAGRPVSAQVAPAEEKTPADAVNFCDSAALVSAGLLVLGLLCFLWWFAPVVKS
jgi:hypothetical protein